MKTEKKSLMKASLQLFTDEELKQVYYILGKEKKSLEDTARTFIMKKIREDVREEDFLRDNYIANLLADKVDQSIFLVESTLKRVQKTDLVKICGELKKENLVSKDITKSKLIRRMLNNIPVLELWRSKRLQETFRPKYVSKRDVKSLKTEINKLKDEVGRIYDDVKFRLERLSVIERRLTEFSERLQPLENVFRVGVAPDLQTYMKTLYEEATKIGEELTPESFRGISERLRQRLGIDERTFLLKGIELLLAHYFLTHVKLLPWKPSFEAFLNILREEFEKVRITKDQAEIPTLREHVCRRMGIDSEMFDELLTEAWKKDYVKLDVGAPIAEYDVKYLVTKDGHKFYYVKLKR